MSTFTKFITKAPNTIFGGPSYNQYVSDLSKARKAPTVFDYNIDANKAAGQFIQDKTKEVLGDNPVSNFLGQAATYGSIPLAVFASPFHEAMQVVEEGRMEPGSGIKGFYNAFMNERPFKTAVERGAGVLQSTPLGEAIYNIGGKTADLVSGISRINEGIAGYLPYASEADNVLGIAGETADEELLNEAFQYLGKNSFKPGDSFRSMNDANVYGTIEDDLMKYSDSELMESDTTTKKGILSNFNPLKIMGLLADIYTGGSRRALTKQGSLGILNNIFKRSGEPRPDYQYRTPEYTGQLIASDLYDPKTRTNRFDRAKTLFGQSRTLMDYIQKKKDQRARRAANRARVQQAIQNQQDAGGSVQTSDSYSGIGDVGATGANFSGDFATDSASYDL